MTIPQIREFLDNKPGYKKWGAEKLAEYLGTAPGKVKEAKGELKANKGNYDEYDSKEQHDNEHSNRPNTGAKSKFTAENDQTLKEYCESVGIDYDRIDPYNDVKYWTDSAGRRRYSVVPKTIEEENYTESILEAIKESITPLSIPDVILYTGNNAAIMNVYDAHIDKLSEVGKGYTIEENLALIADSVARIYNWISPHGIKKLYIPIGNDFFNTNGSFSQTKAGTPQELSVHWKESFQLGVSAISGMVSKGLTFAQEVELVPVEGNHDEDKVFYLNEVLKALYANSQRVILSNISKPMHHRKFGKNLLSFAHGKHEKRRVKQLPLDVAEEVPAMWGETKYREMFLGDIHHKEEYRFLRKVDVRGYTVNFLRDISFNQSTWDRNNGYHIGLKSLEAHVFNPDFGQFANFRDTF